MPRAFGKRLSPAFLCRGRSWLTEGVGWGVPVAVALAASEGDTCKVGTRVGTSVEVDSIVGVSVGGTLLGVAVGEAGVLLGVAVGGIVVKVGGGVHVKLGVGVTVGVSGVGLGVDVKVGVKVGVAVPNVSQPNRISALPPCS